MTRAATGTAAGDDARAAALSAAEGAAAGLDGEIPDLVVVFVGAAHAAAMDDVGAVVRDRVAPRNLAGVTAGAVIAAEREIEQDDAVVVWAACLPGATLTPLRFGEPGDGEMVWPSLPEDSAALLLFGDPFSFPADAFLAWAHQSLPGMPVCGGLASAAARRGGNRLLLDESVFEDGGVAVAISGARVRTLVSQGCRPIGSGYVVTRADRNLVQELGGAPPLERLREAFALADARDRDLMRTGLHVGVAIDEYADELGRGDFLIRGVYGADPENGAIALGDVVQVGQTLQFHVRDASSADEDLKALLEDLEGPGAAALLFTCNGRGRRLFGVDDHDASLVAAALRGAPTAGFFAAGEFGPVAGRSYLHGFTASLLVFEP